MVKTSRAPIDLVPAVVAADWPLQKLPTAQAGRRNTPNLSQWEVFTILLGHPVDILARRANTPSRQNPALSLRVGLAGSLQVVLL